LVLLLCAAAIFSSLRQFPEPPVLLVAVGAALGAIGIVRLFRLDRWRPLAAILERFAMPEDEKLTSVGAVDRREIDPQEEARKRAHASRVRVPGRNAPAFSAVADQQIELGPGADPTHPAYLLDTGFRIIDWNEAFGLAFDRTMEGRRGQTVLHWTFMLDNYEEVLDRAVEAFGDEANPPPIHIEPMVYTSKRYGKIQATKRAYHIPKDEKTWSGWLVTLDPVFETPEQERRFRLDLFQVLESNLLWSRYALSYDNVLVRTESYNELLDDIQGRSEKLSRIGPRARVLDLGAGTGTLVKRILEEKQDRFVLAIENNVIMLGQLRSKCKEWLRNDDLEPGLVSIKQDITALPGIADDDFDYVLMNNVLYAVDEPEACLREAYRVLAPDGEIRITGPHRDTNIHRLFRHFRRELKRSKQWSEVEADFERVERINHRRLQDMPGFRWEVHQIREMLERVGFAVFFTEKVYAGQGMLIAARKP
jgi:ubiquinone/menaquinone biosynthesis C-methylase UbiE